MRLTNFYFLQGWDICHMPHLHGLGTMLRFYVGSPTSRSSWVRNNKNCVDPVGIPPQGGRLRRWAINPALSQVAGVAWRDGPLGSTLLIQTHRSSGRSSLDPRRTGWRWKLYQGLSCTICTNIAHRMQIISIK